MLFIKFTDADTQIAKGIIAQFKKQKTKKEIFYNFCFCVLVAQMKFLTVSKVIQRLIDAEFYESSLFNKDKLLELIKEIRFRNRKVEFLIKLHNNFDNISDIFFPILVSDADPLSKRKWLVNGIHGMGMKSASHFLRNNGEEDLAIIDTHILKFLKIDIDAGPFDYLKVEEEFRNHAREHDLSVAVFDALIWKFYSGVDWEKFVY